MHPYNVVKHVNNGKIMLFVFFLSLAYDQAYKLSLDCLIPINIITPENFPMMVEYV